MYTLWHNMHLFQWAKGFLHLTCNNVIISSLNGMSRWRTKNLKEALLVIFNTILMPCSEITDANLNDLMIWNSRNKPWAMITETKVTYLQIWSYLPNLSKIRGFIRQPLEATAGVQLLNITDQTCSIKSSAYFCNDLDFSPYEISLSSLISSNNTRISLVVLVAHPVFIQGGVYFYHHITAFPDFCRSP